MLRVIATALTMTLMASAGGASEVGVTHASSADFTEAFCGADRSGAHIFVVPLAVFEDGGEISCDFGSASMRMSEPEDDPGHVVLNIDPPSGVADGFDCDAKADIGMEEVALNCLPANAEAADHRKN